MEIDKFFIKKVDEKLTRIEKILEKIWDKIESDSTGSGEDVKICIQMLKNKGVLSSKDIANHPMLGKKYAGRGYAISRVMDKVQAQTQCKSTHIGRGGMRYLFLNKRKIERIRSEQKRKSQGYIADRIKELAAYAQQINWYDYDTPIDLRKFIVERTTLSQRQIDNLIHNILHIPFWMENYVTYHANDTTYFYKKGSNIEQNIKQHIRSYVNNPSNWNDRGKHYVNIRNAIPIPLSREMIDGIQDQIYEQIEKKKEKKREAQSKARYEIKKAIEENSPLLEDNDWLREKARILGIPSVESLKKQLQTKVMKK